MATKQPNILIIWGDDSGWFNPSCYHQGLMAIEPRTSTASPPRARASPTGTGNKAAPLVGSHRSAPV
jgi:arylsulfatase A-like enzyme